MIYVITGQTATGKTSYALKLAQELGGELINADARQLYKNLDIVTGKDLNNTSGPYRLIEKYGNADIGYYPFNTSNRLWLYDILTPNQPFSPYDYKKCAQWVIDNIKSRGKIPIIVGGSYFYIQHLLYNVVDNNVPPNQDLRDELNHYTTQELQVRLKKLNANLFDSLNNSEQNNPQRLIRKIEKEEYDFPFKGSTSEHAGGRNVGIQITGFQFKKIQDLEEAIRSRVEKRIEFGAIDETKQLLNDGYTAHDPGMKTIGYTQIIQHLNDELTRDQMKEVWITKEVQYAKRQFTFMKKDINIVWKYR